MEIFAEFREPANGVFFCSAADTRRSHFVHTVRGEHVGRIDEHGRRILEQRAENHRTHRGADLPPHRNRNRVCH